VHHANFGPSYVSRPAAALAACKADWSKARANYGSWVRDEFLLDSTVLALKVLQSLAPNRRMSR